MNQTVQKITQDLIDLLPENDQYYRLEELRSWGFPPFIVQRIQIELERNLAESMIPPETDWANIQSQAVRDAWQQFVEAIRAETRLPASYAKTVIETAVADVLEMLVKPRTNIPEVIFGTKERLTFEQLSERLKSVVVYPHFSTLLMRYMGKKRLDQLTKQRCKEVITKADQKLTARYSPLNWAQTLEPLFQLLDGEIDTNILRLYFEDKGMPRVARYFDLMNDSLSRAEMIEMLSSPDSLDFNGDAEIPSEVFENQPADPLEENKNRQEQAKPPSSAPEEYESIREKPKNDRTGEGTGEQEKGPENRRREEPEPEGREPEKEKREPEEEKRKSERKKVEKPPEADYENEHPEQSANSLNTVFSPPSMQDDIDEGESDERDDYSLNAFFEAEEEHLPPENLEFEEPEEEIWNERRFTSEPSEVEDDEDIKDTGAEDIAEEAAEEETGSERWVPDPEGEINIEKLQKDEEDSPIWMRFISDDTRHGFTEQEEEAGHHNTQSAEKDEVEEGFLDEPIVDVTQGHEEPARKLEEIESLFSREREQFVAKIFQGSHRAFNEALETIASFESWRDASRFIEKEVFRRNHVDMYSESAVDFTDRLQNYFLEKQN